MPDIDESPLLNGYFDHVPDDADASVTTAVGIGVTWEVNALGTNGAATVSRQAFTFGQTSVPENPEYFLRWAQTTAGDTNPVLLNKVEDVRTFADEFVTVHGFYRSNVAVDLRIRQDFGSGGSPSADVTVGTQTLPNTVDANGTAQWKPFSVTMKMPSVNGKTLGSTANTSYVGVEFRGPTGTTFQYDIGNVRMTRGTSRDTSKRRPKQVEKQLLDRFYWAASVQAQNAAFHVGFPVQMRAAPTMAASAGTVDTSTVDGFSLTHNAEAAVSVTADARMSA